MHYLGHTYTLKKSVVYLRFAFTDCSLFCLVLLELRAQAACVQYPSHTLAGAVTRQADGFFVKLEFLPLVSPLSRRIRWWSSASPLLLQKSLSNSAAPQWADPEPDLTPPAACLLCAPVPLLALPHGAEAGVREPPSRASAATFISLQSFEEQ